MSIRQDMMILKDSHKSTYPPLRTTCTRTRGEAGHSGQRTGMRTGQPQDNHRTQEYEYFLCSNSRPEWFRFNEIESAHVSLMVNNKCKLVG